jgi:hypothetical protein
MASAGVAGDAFLDAKGVGPAGYFASIILYTFVCSAYIVYQGEREEKAKPVHPPRRRREARP